MTTAETVIAYYQALLIAQYIDKPRAAATIGALAGGSDGAHGLVANAIYTQVRDGFDLLGIGGNAPAVGAQLDFLGELIGPTRYITDLVLGTTFVALPSYDDPDPGSYAGLSTYDLSQPPSWETMNYDDFTQDALTDGDYRRVLAFLAKLNGLWYSYANLDALLFAFFAGNVNLIVTGNMAYTYQHLTSDPDNLFGIINTMGLLPAPAGVSVTVAEVASF